MATGGVPVSGARVVFTVAAGGGTISGGSVITGADGVARVGAWVLGGTTGADANVVRASAGGLSADFRATAAPPAPHQITLRYINTPTRAQQTAFEQAWLRWRDIVRSELTDVNYAANPDTDPCGAGGILPAGLVLNEVVDDLIIYVNLRNIDGAGSVLGSAGPCQARGTLQALGMPMVGVMTFDTSDLGSLEGSGQLANVILHEMGHVLGIGSLWEEYGVLNGGGTDTTAFTGAAGRAVWQSLGGAAGTKVPVENCVGRSNCGAGTRDSHWRESTFNNELMTGFLNGGTPNPLSALTIASLQDIGYTVDATRADAYALPTGASTSGVLGNLVSTGPLRALVEQPLPNELRITDTQGRSLGTISEWKRRRGLK
jgi:hypothetical protein